MANISLHSQVLGEESTFRFPDPDPELRRVNDEIEGDRVDGEGSAASDEEWENCIEKIHQDFKYRYIRIVPELKYTTRINMYKVLSSLHWTKDSCALLLELLDGVGPERRDVLINSIITFYPDRRELYMKIIQGLEEPQLGELLTDLPIDIVQYFIEICRYLNPFQREFEIFSGLVRELSFREVYDLMNFCNEPFAKQCRLCRLRRLHILEFRMSQGQLKPEDYSKPGVVEHYETATVWKADGEHFFSFGYSEGRVFWRGKEVDLVKICDGCLDDVNKALAEVNRLEPVFHLEGAERKEKLTEMRVEEKARAKLIRELSVKRLHRRAKEWSIRALKSLREGYIREEQERQEATSRILRQRAEAARREAQQQALHAALHCDQRWKKQEQRTQQQRSSKRDDLAGLNFQLPFSRDLPAEPSREHHHSWQLAAFSPSGLPLCGSAAAERFGTGKVKADIRTPELSMWKNQSAYLHKNYLERVAAEERCQAEARRKEAEDLNKYLQEHQFASNRAAKLRRLAAEQAEEDRLEARALAKAKRREARLKAGESEERKAMAEEDERSQQHRYYLKECEIIRRELSNMRREEAAQTAIDRYWGIPTSIVNMKNKKEENTAAWVAKVEELRALGMQTANWVPYKFEIGEFRDKFTGRAIREVENVKEYEHYKGKGPNRAVDYTGSHTILRR